MNGLLGTVAQPYDVIVVGAGIVGAAIARALAAYRLSIALVDAREDVGEGTSKANTAILHTGFDATPGTLESRLVARGCRLLADYATVVGIPVERTGALMVAWTDEERDALAAVRTKAQDNGYTATEPVGRDEVYRRVPHLGPGALAGLAVPDESITCTWTTNLALATEATLRGVTLLLNRHITDVACGATSTTLYSPRTAIRGRWIINAAGLGSDLIDRMFGQHHLTITPRRGELIVFDKLARPLIDHIVLPVPTARGKGVLVSPTIYGNVMVGPTAEDLDDRTATATSDAGIADLLEKGKELMPRLLDEEITATYAGLRAACEHDDYVIRADPDQRYILVGGIRSTGLTSGMAIAEHVLDLLDDSGLPLVDKDRLPAPPNMPNLGEAFCRPYQDPTRVAHDPAYGRIVCFCERVTEGEVRDAFRSPIPPATLSGLSRRTRVLNGRCQGFYCGGHVRELATRYAQPATDEAK